MPSTDTADATAVVTGASRGYARCIAAALSRARAQVVGVARNHAQLRRFMRNSATPSSPGMTPEQAGKAITDLVTSTGYDQDAYVLTGAD